MASNVCNEIVWLNLPVVGMSDNATCQYICVSNLTRLQLYNTHTTHFLIIQLLMKDAFYLIYNHDHESVLISPKTNSCLVNDFLLVGSTGRRGALGTVCPAGL